jgi:hypothetical protein
MSTSAARRRDNAHRRAGGRGPDSGGVVPSRCYHELCWFPTRLGSRKGEVIQILERLSQKTNRTFPNADCPKVNASMLCREPTADGCEWSGAKTGTER